MNAEMFMFRMCFSQTLSTAHVYPQFERICGYSGFLAELERADLDDPLKIAALACITFARTRICTCSRLSGYSPTLKSDSESRRATRIFWRSMPSETGRPLTFTMF